MAKKPGLGLLLPVELGSNGYFNVGYDALTQVKSNLTNLILTKKGERIMQPEFGCDVHKYVFDHITDDLLVQIRGSIEESIQVWMPFVTVDNVEVTKSEDTNEVYIRLSYSLKAGVRITDTITLVLVI